MRRKHLISNDRLLHSILHNLGMNVFFYWWKWVRIHCGTFPVIFSFSINSISFSRNGWIYIILYQLFVTYSHIKLVIPKYYFTLAVINICIFIIFPAFVFCPCHSCSPFSFILYSTKLYEFFVSTRVWLMLSQSTKSIDCLTHSHYPGSKESGKCNTFSVTRFRCGCIVSMAWLNVIRLVVVTGFVHIAVGFCDSKNPKRNSKRDEPN